MTARWRPAVARSLPPWPAVRVVLVDECTATRSAIAERFEREDDIRVVGQARSIAEARELLFDVDVAVVALHLPDGLGSDIIQSLRARSPRAEAVIVGAELEPKSVARAVHDGAAAVLDEAASLDEVLDAVRRLNAGDPVLPRDAVARLLSYERLRREPASVLLRAPSRP